MPWAGGSWQPVAGRDTFGSARPFSLAPGLVESWNSVVEWLWEAVRGAPSSGPPGSLLSQGLPWCLGGRSLPACLWRGVVFLEVVGGLCVGWEGLWDAGAGAALAAGLGWSREVGKRKRGGGRSQALSQPEAPPLLRAGRPPSSAKGEQLHCWSWSATPSSARQLLSWHFQGAAVAIWQPGQVWGILENTGKVAEVPHRGQAGSPPIPPRAAAWQFPVLGVAF